MLDGQNNGIVSETNKNMILLSANKSLKKVLKKLEKIENRWVKFKFEEPDKLNEATFQKKYIQNYKSIKMTAEKECYSNKIIRTDH